MFLGHGIDKWVGLLEYAIIVLTLFIGTYYISIKLSDKLFSSKKKIVKRKRKDDKKWFYDVA